MFFCLLYYWMYLKIWERCDSRGCDLSSSRIWWTWIEFWGLYWSILFLEAIQLTLIRRDNSHFVRESWNGRLLTCAIWMVNFLMIIVLFFVFAWIRRKRKTEFWGFQNITIVVLKKDTGKACFSQSWILKM